MILRELNTNKGKSMDFGVRRVMRVKTGGRSKVSLRVGHAAGLTSHRDVIQHRVAASLPCPTARQADITKHSPRKTQLYFLSRYTILSGKLRDFFAERANATKAYFLYVEERRRGYAEKESIYPIKALYISPDNCASSRSLFLPRSFAA